MGRSDGTLVKDIPAFDKLIPHMMDKRYDATNFAKIEFDMTNLQEFLRNLRADGHSVGTMDAIIAAFALMLKKRPEINRFIANKRVYQRNHVCVSFALIKKGPDQELMETAIKVYIQPDDNLITISKNIRNIIKENKLPQTQNAVDRFVDRLMSMPLIPGLCVGIIKLMDKYGFLPKSIIALSPFHTSMFISNLASIRMSYVYHHLYEFGTTSLFVTLGKPEGKQEDKTKKMMTLGVSIDERICTGAVWAKAFYEFKRCIENPERLMEEIKK
ncbi:MAG: 2-oxo acid dehydrogenase subunit E2 [Defluviitaleaceae bacterium]|nr:2-oxo acid dehydrogenase subunit E2 [Defluviitaleaceae bacterium]